jgi:hypothetical protein
MEKNHDGAQTELVSWVTGGNIGATVGEVDDGMEELGEGHLATVAARAAAVAD